MSVKAINWALELSIPPTPKLVLVVLADYADEYGYAFPGGATIARRASISERTLTRVLADLEENGYLERERRSLLNGNRTSDGYRLLPDETNRQNGVLSRRQNEGVKTPTVASVGEPPVEPPVQEKARARATQMPALWEPSNAHAAQALAAKVDIEIETLRFRDWALSKGATYVDWEAAFRNWIRRAAEMPRQRPDAPVRRDRDTEIRDLLSGSLGLDDMGAIAS